MHGRSALLALVLAGQALTQTALDPIAQLGREIENRKTVVRFDPDRGYLPWLLETLDIPTESQMLVFSKTGVQALRTEPANPRRIYFNDSVIVATVNGGPIEIAAQDPNHGLMFYLLDQTPFRYREFAERATRVSPFSRRTDCLHCHGTGTTGVAATLIRSVVTDSSGAPLDSFGSRETDNRTPFDQLWGGWFVTGKATGKHMGNTVTSGGRHLPVVPVSHSDVAALLVFEHQTRIMSLIARVKLTGQGVDELARAMLFLDEAKLPEKVEGSSGFAEKFMERGPKDRAGHSLRDLDLTTRLQRYPCSYMIYSEAFQALPGTVKAHLYHRIAEQNDPDVNAILAETLAGFKSAAPSAGSR